MSIVTVSELTPEPATPASASVEEGTVVQIEEFDMMMFLLFVVVKNGKVDKPRN